MRIISSIAGFVGDYTAQKAELYAQLSSAAYCGPPKLPGGRALEAWQCGPACDAVRGMTDVRSLTTPEWDNAFGFIGKLNGTCIVSFRGTSNLHGWVEDLESGVHVNSNYWKVLCEFEGEPCHVGLGFMENYWDIAPELKGNLTEMGCKDMPMAVTGHSLGAAIGYIAMMDLHNEGYNIVESYTFGSPRTGDHIFKKAFARIFDEEKHFRVTNCHDPVPHLPPARLNFHHSGTEIFYDCEDKTQFKVCEASSDGMTLDDTCASQFSNVAVDLLHVFDHLKYMQHQTGHDMAGAHCTDPVMFETDKVCGGISRMTGALNKCMLPFEYDDANHTHCISDHAVAPWCYTDSRRNWGYCGCTEATAFGNGRGAPCVFPFFWKGKEYNNCTMDDYHAPWCAVDFQGRWGLCVHQVR